MPRSKYSAIEVIPFSPENMTALELEAVARVACSTCAQLAGYPCVYVALLGSLGEILLHPHSPRIQLLIEMKNGL